MTNDNAFIAVAPPLSEDDEAHQIYLAIIGDRDGETINSFLEDAEIDISGLSVLMIGWALKRMEENIAWGCTVSGDIRLPSVNAMTEYAKDILMSGDFHE